MKCCHATWMDLDSIMPREISFSKRGFNSIIRTGHGTTHWFQNGKGVCQGCKLSPCLFNFYADYFMRNASWMNHKLDTRLLGGVSTTSEMQMILLQLQ